MLWNNSNCGTQDPDCDNNLDTKTNFIILPKENYWSTNAGVVYNCSNLCKDMICRESHCYGVCNMNEYLANQENLRKFQILSIINTMLLGLLIIVVSSLLYINCSFIESTTNQNEKDQNEKEKIYKKSTFSKFILLDIFRINIMKSK